jgi:hypothetical protein
MDHLKCVTLKMDFNLRLCYKDLITPAYLTSVSITRKKSYIKLASGVNLIKLFWHKLIQSFCKLHLFKTLRQILFTFIKRPSLQKVRVKLRNTSFMR